MSTVPGVCPVGSIIAWAKSLANTSSLANQGRGEWVQCDGQTLSDTQSVYNGTVIPALNNNSRFLRGQSTSGGTGGTDAVHSHTVGTPNNAFTSGSPGGFGFSTSSPITTGTTDGRPAFYNVVWIMRIK